MMRVPAISFDAGPVVISAHFLFESLAYAAGFALYRHDRRKRGDLLQQPDRSSVIVAAILGAALGSKLLAMFEDPAVLSSGSLLLILAGKTIVGGLLGGTMAVEWVKARLGIHERTGDLFALPIVLGMALGRLGCFFGGLQDRTYGSPTHLPWAMDFGDGIARHPVQLYEILFLAALAGVLLRLRHRSPANGTLYRVFLLSYLGWRFAIDFLKPEPAFAGLSTIQWVCAAAMVWYSRDIVDMAASWKELNAHG